MMDLISRQAAIEAIKTWGLIDGLSEGQAIEILADEEKLPSAQPEIIACGQGELVQDGLRLVQDCIDRQEAIDAADKIIKRDTSGNNDVVKAMTAWKSYIEQLPSAQPERKTGKWLYDEERCATGIYAICSACDESIYQTGNFRYRPNCGAEMRGDANVDAES